MQLTKYEIIETPKSTIVMSGAYIVSRTVLGIESALHSIWVMEGRQQNHFYKHKDGKVYLEIEEDEEEMFLRHMEEMK